jgi:hypothetical protein
MVNQDLCVSSRTVGGGMGIFGNGDVITPANAVLDRRIDAVIGGAAADDKLANALLRSSASSPVL